jgi:hypothetical protein
VELDELRKKIPVIQAAFAHLNLKSESALLAEGALDDALDVIIDFQNNYTVGLTLKEDK